MIDLHCHILPGIDDGPETTDESMEMCRMAASDGIETIVVTPHFSPGIRKYIPGEITGLIDTLTEQLAKEGVGIRLLPGADITITPELLNHLKSEKYLTINKNGRYFLAEFPSNMVPPNWDAFLLSFLCSDMIPIITHPERNLWFLNNPEALYQIVSKGVMVQITAMSITGGFGADAREFCAFLLEHNLVHVIATDAHSTTYRPPLLKEAVNQAADIVGKERAISLVSSIPAAIIEGNTVSLPVPIRQVNKKKRWMQRLYN